MSESGKTKSPPPSDGYPEKPEVHFKGRFWTALCKSGQLANLSRAEILVLAVFYDHVNDQGETWPGAKRIEQLTGLAERSVYNGMNGLRAKGLMETVGAGGGARNTARRRLIIPYADAHPDQVGTLHPGAGITLQNPACPSTRTLHGDAKNPASPCTKTLHPGAGEHIIEQIKNRESEVAPATEAAAERETLDRLHRCWGELWGTVYGTPHDPAHDDTERLARVLRIAGGSEERAIDMMRRYLAERDDKFYKGHPLSKLASQGARFLQPVRNVAIVARPAPSPLDSMTPEELKAAVADYQATYPKLADRIVKRLHSNPQTVREFVEFVQIGIGAARPGGGR